MNGMYEAALIDGYVGMKHGTRHYPMLHLLRLFRLADRVKLMQLSDRAQTFPITVYRGVAGRGRSRRIRGLSWTSNLNIACWFARRAGIKLDDPAVYEATMTLENVFCSCKYECEIIGYPSKCRRMSMTLKELTTKAEMWDRENEESRLRLIEEYKTQQPVTEVFNAVD